MGFSHWDIYSSQPNHLGKCRWRNLIEIWSLVSHLMSVPCCQINMKKWSSQSMHNRYPRVLLDCHTALQIRGAQLAVFAADMYLRHAHGVIFEVSSPLLLPVRVRRSVHNHVASVNFLTLFMSSSLMYRRIREWSVRRTMNIDILACFLSSIWSVVWIIKVFIASSGSPFGQVLLPWLLHPAFCTSFTFIAWKAGHKVIATSRNHLKTPDLVKQV